MTVEAPTRLDDAVSQAAGELARAAPELTGPFLAAVPAATDVVTGRLRAALRREGLAVGAGAGPLDGPAIPAGLAGELADAVVGLALGYARRPAIDARLRFEASVVGALDTVDLAAGRPADEQMVLFERLATEGHNLHPCGRTRLGWSVADRLAHDLESPGTGVGFVTVRPDLLLGDDLDEHLAGQFAGGLPGDPVHEWQLRRVLPARYPELLAGGALRVVDAAPAPALPTAALRTVLLPGTSTYLKLSLDILVTSTRRTISVASTRNGPALSALLHELLAGEDRLVLMPEVAGSAVPATGRDLAVIVRRGLSGRLRPDEVAVPGTALAAHCPLTGEPVAARLVSRFATTRGVPDGPVAALGFVAGYARLLLPPLLRLVTGAGIALEVHLQNSVVTFTGGVPARLALRDFAGLRISRHRAAAGRVRLWPGSVVWAADDDALRAKLAYTVLHAHLGELVGCLATCRGLDAGAAWRTVRGVVDETYDALGDTGRADHAYFTAPTVPHKALVRMRLAGSGDLYVPVPNPLTR